MESPASFKDCFYFDEMRPRGLSLGRRLLMAFVLNDPGYSAAVLVRIQQHLFSRGWGRLARLVARVNYTLNAGVEVSERAVIGQGLHFHHCQGTVIGGDSKVGRNVHFFKNVLLGIRNLKYPEIGDNCILYANCVIVGGIKVGANSIVAPNAVVVENVPEGKVAAGNPARVLKDAEYFYRTVDGVPVKTSAR